MLLSLYSSTRAAVDLASVMVGIIIIGIIGGLIAAAIFAVIPWSQDRQAKANIDAVRTAENAYRGFSAEQGAPGSYGNNTELAAAKTSDTTTSSLLAKTHKDRLTVAASKGPDGEPCYSVASKSDSGKVFYATSKNSTISEDSSTTAACVPLGDPTSNPGGGNNVPSVPDVSAQVALPDNVQAGTKNAQYNISGYDTNPSVETVTNLVNASSPAMSNGGQVGYWYPDNNADITVSYYDKSAGKYVPFLTRADNYSNQSMLNDATIMYDNSAGLLWGWYGNYVQDDTIKYADEFQKMAENGGSVSFKSNGSTIAAAWGPAAGNSPDSGVPGSGTDTPPGNGGIGGGTGGDGGNGGNPPAQLAACGTLGSASYSSESTDWFWGLIDQGNSCDLSAGTGIGENDATYSDTNLGTPSAEGYSYHSVRAYAFGQGSGWYNGHAEKVWAAANGTTIKVQYYDDNHNLQTVGNYTANDNTPYAYSPSSHKESDPYSFYTQDGYDDNAPFIQLHVGKELPFDNWGDQSASYPDVCVDQFMNENYGQPYTPSSTGTAGEPITGVCPDPNMSVSFSVYNIQDTSYSDKLNLISKNGGQVTFTTTAGKKLTLPIGAGGYRYYIDNSGQAS